MNPTMHQPLKKKPPNGNKSAEERLKNMRGLLEKTGLAEAVAFATLSSSILRSVHDFSQIAQRF